jgi:hypothetical protein
MKINKLTFLIKIMILFNNSLKLHKMILYQFHQVTEKKVVSYFQMMQINLVPHLINKKALALNQSLIFLLTNKMNRKIR